MAYNQDLINQAHQICQKFIREKGFEKMDLIDKMLLANIPEDLARAVVEDYEVDEKSLKKVKAKKYLTYGVLLLLVSIFITIGLYVFTEHIYIILTGVTIVPGLALVGAGLWEMFE
jgi:hypothetical protein